MSNNHDDIAHGPVKGDDGENIEVWPWAQKLEFDSDGNIGASLVCEIRVDGSTYTTATIRGGGDDGATVYCTDFGYSNGEFYRDDGYKHYNYTGPLTEEIKTAMRTDIAEAVVNAITGRYDDPDPDEDGVEL